MTRSDFDTTAPVVRVQTISCGSCAVIVALDIGNLLRSDVPSHSRRRLAVCHPPNYSSALLIFSHSHPGRDLAAICQVQLGQDVLDVVLRGAFGQMEPIANFSVGEPPRHEV